MRDSFRDIVPPEEESAAPRGIRSINLPSRARSVEREHVPHGYPPPRHGRRSSKIWPWIIALVSFAVLGGLALFAMRATTVTVVPRTQPIVFDGLPALTAYPAQTAATGTLTYTVQEFDLEESEPVAAAGLTHVERKASGSVTVFNAYSAAPVKLLAGTRFATADGLIFRAPAAITIPGKKGSSPGSISVTVIADSAGDRYNVPAGRFTLPGLKGGAMYASVYATSEAAFSGGFSGDEPATDPSALAAAQSAMRSRIEKKVHEAVPAEPGSIALPDLARITYADLPSTPEGEGKVRLHERAHVAVPVFRIAQLAAAVAPQVSADASGADIRLVTGASFGAKPAEASLPILGSDPLSFTLAGKAQLVWQVDAAGLASALAGRDGTSFEQIVRGFPGIQDARARIEPFWNTSFPKDPESIRVVIEAAPAL